MKQCRYKNLILLQTHPKYFTKTQYYALSDISTCSMFDKFKNEHRSNLTYKMFQKE